MKICVLLPAYNEGSTIAGLVKDIMEFTPHVVAVDDGSSDDTADEARRAGAVVISNKKNMGKGASLRKGFAYVCSKDYDAVITMDADRQHDVAEIPVFVDKMLETGADIVLGTRMGSVEGMPFIRRLTNLATSLVVSVLCGCRITDSQIGYRMLKTDVLRQVELKTSNYETESEILIKAARKKFLIKEAPVKTIYCGQASQIKPGRDTVRFIRLVLTLVIKNG